MQRAQRVDWRALDVTPRLVRFDTPGMSATLNGIAQGYAADHVRAVLASRGIRHALVDAGEFAPLGQGSESQPWTLGIADPREEAALIARLVSDGRCIATSADTSRASAPTTGITTSSTRTPATRHPRWRP